MRGVRNYELNRRCYVKYIAEQNSEVLTPTMCPLCILFDSGENLAYLKLGHIVAVGSATQVGDDQQNGWWNLLRNKRLQPLFGRVVFYAMGEHTHKFDVLVTAVLAAAGHSALFSSVDYQKARYLAINYGGDH